MKQAKYEILVTNNTVNIDRVTLSIMRSYENELAPSLHWHDGMEINLITEGYVTYLAGGRKYEAGIDQLVFVNSGEIHVIENPLPDTYATALVMIIPDSFFHQYVPKLGRPYFQLQKNSEAYRNIVSCMYAIKQILEGDDTYPELLIQKHMLEILHVLCTGCMVKYDRTERDEQIQKILHYTEEHFAEELSLQEISGIAGLQENYFCRWFQKHTGMTYHHYLMHIRLDHALRELALRGGAISSCAVSAGFSSDRQLNIWCKRIYRCTPTQYVKRLRIVL